MYHHNGNNSPLKAILDPEQCQQILEAAHENLRHRGEYTVMQTIKERSYWSNI